MATNHTQNLSLPQWDALDPFQRSEFNDAFATLDETLGALDGAAKITTGTYTGNGQSSQSIDVGFMPRALCITAANGDWASLLWMYGAPCGLVFNRANMVSGRRMTISWTETGVTWSSGESSNDPAPQLNSNGASYHWLAFG